MAYMIEISEKKYEKLSEHIEESLRHLGKAMSCITEVGEPYGMGYRDDEMTGYRYENYGQRGDYGYRGGMGYRDEEERWREEEMRERRGRQRRDSRGRYM